MFEESYRLLVDTQSSLLAHSPSFFSVSPSRHPPLYPGVGLGDSGRWITLSFLSSTIPTFSFLALWQPACRCCSSYLNSIHWRLQLLAQIQGLPRPFILVSPDLVFALPETTCQSPSPHHTSTSLGTLPLDVDNNPFNLVQQSLSLFC